MNASIEHTKNIIIAEIKIQKGYTLKNIFVGKK